MQTAGQAKMPVQIGSGTFEQRQGFVHKSIMARRISGSPSQTASLAPT
jgi:hypothetical protein